MGKIFGIRKIAAFVLAMCIMFTCLPVTAIAASDLSEEKLLAEKLEFNSLCILGDSAAAGYGLENYEIRAASANIHVKDDPAVEGCYGEIVSNYYGLEPKARAHCGWRTTEFLRAVTSMCDEDMTWTAENFSTFDYKNHTPEQLSDFFFTSLYMADPNAIKSEYENIPKDIADSSIITVNFGANDIYTYALIKTISKYGDQLNFIRENHNQGDLRARFAEILKKAVSTPEILTFFNKKCAEGLMTYKKNMPLVLDYIRGINPEAQVFVLGIDNPAKYYLIQNDAMTINALEPVGCYAKFASWFNLRMCNQRSNCIYVEVSDVEYYGLNGVDFGLAQANSADRSLNLLAFIKAVHPNENGHQQLAEKIIHSYEVNKTSPTIVDISVDTNGMPTITWEAFTGAYRYKVYRSTDRNSNYRLVFETLQPTTSYTDRPILGISKPLDPNKTYYYKIVAVMNRKGTLLSGASNIVERPPVPIDSMPINIPSYTMIFNANGHGADPEKQIVDSFMQATEPLAPIVEGYTFGGWYREPECINQWNFDTDLVTEDIILYAKWIEDNTTLSEPTEGTETSKNDEKEATGANDNAKDSAVNNQTRTPRSYPFEVRDLFKRVW